MKIDTTLKVFVGILVFLIGFLSSAFISSFFGIEFEVPFLIDQEGNSSPSDFIDDKDILVYPDRVVIFVDDASLGKYAPTGSMKPILDERTNGIRIKPNNADEIFVGDIVTFRKNGILIIHRVIEKGIDKEGIYFVTQGDNNNLSDGKIRFSDIEYKTIGFLY